MSTRTDLEAALLEDWKNKTRALVLADYLCEHCDLDRTAALRAVANLRRSQRDAEEIAEATQLVRADTRESSRLHTAILDATRAHYWTQYTGYVIVTRGYHRPRINETATADTGGRPVIVSVGARWVLAWVAWYRGERHPVTGSRRVPFGA